MKNIKRLFIGAAWLSIGSVLIAKGLTIKTNIPKKKTSILENGTKVKITNQDPIVYGTIAGNDLDNSEEDLSNLNYYVIPDGKTFNEEIQELWSNIEVI